MKKAGELRRQVEAHNTFPIFQCLIHINIPFVMSHIILLERIKSVIYKGKERFVSPVLISINKLNIMRFETETSFTSLNINNSHPLSFTKVTFYSTKGFLLKHISFIKANQLLG